MKRLKLLGIMGASLVIMLCTNKVYSTTTIIAPYEFGHDSDLNTFVINGPGVSEWELWISLTDVGTGAFPIILFDMSTVPLTDYYSLNLPNVSDAFIGNTVLPQEFGFWDLQWDGSSTSYTNRNYMGISGNTIDVTSAVQNAQDMSYQYLGFLLRPTNNYDFSSSYGTIGGVFWEPYKNIFLGASTEPSGQIPDPSLPGIPIPAAVWLFGSGLIGLIGIARRRKA